MAKTADNLDLLNRAGSVKFSDLIFEVLSEKVPSDHESKIFELILNLSIDHGPETPSAVKVIEAAKSGKNISEAVSVGVLEINDSHGGAIEPLMEILYNIKNAKVTVVDLVNQYLAESKRIPGFGHRIYKETDPRAVLIINALDELLGSDPYIAMIDDLQKELNTQTSKQLPLNIDGAIAVVLCSFGWEPRLGKAVFIIARSPGLCAHYLNNVI